MEQALWEMGPKDWVKMVSTLFPDFTVEEVSVDNVVTLIRETNTCSNPNFPVEVWIDEAGDFRIKVYDA